MLACGSLRRLHPRNRTMQNRANPNTSSVVCVASGHGAVGVVTDVGVEVWAAGASHAPLGFLAARPLAWPAVGATWSGGGDRIAVLRVGGDGAAELEVYDVVFDETVGQEWGERSAEDDPAHRPPRPYTGATVSLRSATPAPGARCLRPGRRRAQLLVGGDAGWCDVVAWDGTQRRRYDLAPHGAC